MSTKSRKEYDSFKVEVSKYKDKMMSGETLDALYSQLAGLALGAAIDHVINEENWLVSPSVFSEVFLTDELPESVWRIGIVLKLWRKTTPKHEIQTRLKKAIDIFRKELLEDGPGIKVSHFRMPNPHETITKFCKHNHLHHSTSFVNLISPQDDGVVCMTTQRRILRLIQFPDLKKLKAPNRSQRSFAELLCAKMRTHDPKRYASMSVDDLLWLPKTEAAR
jgi:hypothetical protein